MIQLEAFSNTIFEIEASDPTLILLCPNLMQCNKTGGLDFAYT